MRRFLLLAFFATAGLVSPVARLPLRAQDDPQRAAALEAARQFTAIRMDWEKTERAFQDALRAAKTSEEFQRVYERDQPDPKPFAARCLKLAEAYPDTGSGASALYWVLCHAEGTEYVRPAFEQFKEGPLAKADLGMLWSDLFFNMGPASAPLRRLTPLVFARVAKELDHPKAADLLMWVCYAVDENDSSAEGDKLFRQTADLLMSRFADAPYLWEFCGLRQLQDDPEWAEKHLRTALAKNQVPAVRVAASLSLAALLQNRDADSQGEAEELYRRVIQEAGPAETEWNQRVANLQHRESTKLLRRKATWVQTAQRELKEIQAHGLGKPAAEIDGEGLDGKPLRLSDYRGKVVMLSFWASWCAPCMALVPHERELVKQREGKPFVVLGVNGDQDLTQAREAVTAKGITWPSFKDRATGATAISQAWRLRGWPTLYLIDHQGIIRKRWVGAPRGEILDREVDRLIAAAEKER